MVFGLQSPVYFNPIILEFYFQLRTYGKEKSIVY